MVEITERRGLQDGHHLYRTRAGLETAAKGFDRVLAAVQRSIARFGNPKAPDSLSIESTACQRHSLSEPPRPSRGY